MLKGRKNANLEYASLDVLNLICLLLKISDIINDTKFSKEFEYIYIDKTAYTMNEIGDMTSYFVNTIRRHINKFNKHIELVKLKKHEIMALLFKILVLE